MYNALGFIPSTEKKFFLVGKIFPSSDPENEPASPGLLPHPSFLHGAVADM